MKILGTTRVLAASLIKVLYLLSTNLLELEKNQCIENLKSLNLLMFKKLV
jgi:hypothetical protein